MFRNHRLQCSVCKVQVCDSLWHVKVFVQCISTPISETVPDFQWRRSSICTRHEYTPTILHYIYISTEHEMSLLTEIFKNSLFKENTQNSFPWMTVGMQITLSQQNSRTMQLPVWSSMQQRHAVGISCRKAHTYIQSTWTSTLHWISRQVRYLSTFEQNETK